MIAPVLPVRRDVGNGERLQYLRAWRPGGWTPEIDIVGTDHVSAALAQGRGVVFLGGNVSFNNLVPKIAMNRLNLEVVVFFNPRHGFSNRAFGVRFSTDSIGTLRIDSSKCDFRRGRSL